RPEACVIAGRIACIPQRHAAVVVVERPSICLQIANGVPRLVHTRGKELQIAAHDGGSRLGVGNRQAVPIDFLVRPEAKLSCAFGRLPEWHGHRSCHPSGVPELLASEMPAPAGANRVEGGRLKGGARLPRRKERLRVWILDPTVSDEQWSAWAFVER